MPALLNKRHEKFAQMVATDPTRGAGEIYRELFGAKGASADVGAAKLKVKLRLRIEEIGKGYAKHREEQAEKQLATRYLNRDEMLAFLADVLRTAPGEIDKDSPLCQSYKLITTETGGTTEYKMPDKLRALELAAKIEKIITSDNQTSQTVNVAVALNVMTEDRRKELLDKKRAAVEYRRAKPLAVTNGSNGNGTNGHSNGNGHKPN